MHFYNAQKCKLKILISKKKNFHKIKNFSHEHIGKTIQNIAESHICRQLKTCNNVYWMQGIPLTNNKYIYTSKKSKPHKYMQYEKCQQLTSR